MIQKFACFLSMFGMVSASFAGDVSHDILNFSQVSPGLYRGARPSDQGVQDLAALGVKTIIDLQGGDLQSGLPQWFVSKVEPGETPSAIAAERAHATSLGLFFVSSPLNSLGDVTPEEDRMIDQTLQTMGDPARQPVYIHCEHGKDRTGLVVALYEVKYLGMSVEDAHRDMVKNGHGVLNQMFTHDMDEYFYQKAPTLRPAPTR